MSGGVLAVLEPIGVCRDDGKRPDGISLVTGLTLALGLYHSDTLAPSNLSTSASGASWLVTLQSQLRSDSILL